VTGASADSELALIVQAQRGDKQAFGELVRCHQAGVVGVAYRLCGNARLAEDAAQEAFVRAWQHLPAYQPRSAFRNWLYRIATNATLDSLRRERPSLELDELTPDRSDDGLQARVERHEQADVVRQAVMALPDASRAVLVLREYEEMSYREIADTLGIPMGTVMSRLSYARERLRSSLSHLLEAR
jgi:RNA polymerase sigma-70 factor (ECF subfamily)